jgi:hypothetical protein
MGVLGWTCGSSEGRADFRSDALSKGTASRGCRCSETMVTGRAKRD